MFCNICIAGWAGGGHPHCPICPNSLFLAAAPEDVVVPKSPLSRVVDDFRETLYVRAAYRVGRNINFNTDASYAAAMFFASFRRGEVKLAETRFGIRFNTKEIDAHLVALGNIAPDLAAEVGKPYTSKQLEHLPRVLEALSAIFGRLGRMRVDCLDEDASTATILKASVCAELQRQGIDLYESGFMAEAARSESRKDRTKDLDTLLDYVLLVAHQSLLNKPLPAAPDLDKPLPATPGRGHKRRSRFSV